MQAYARSGLLGSLLEALQADGRDVENLQPADLAAVGAFHIRGGLATRELANALELQAAMQVLDLGCAIGGSARYLAAGWHCQVQGVDLSPEYVDAARELTRRCGLDQQVLFQVANALDLPFTDASFDCVWTEHVQMNIADKVAFYAEIARVLKPGGKLVFHDVFAGNGEALQFPVPWAESAGESFLMPMDTLQALLPEMGLQVQMAQNVSDISLQWFAEQAAAPPTARKAAGIHLLMGENAALKVHNLRQNLAAERVSVWQMIAMKQG